MRFSASRLHGLGIDKSLKNFRAEGSPIEVVSLHGRGVQIVLHAGHAHRVVAAAQAGKAVGQGASRQITTIPPGLPTRSVCGGPTGCKISPVCSLVNEHRCLRLLTGAAPPVHPRAR